jgi:hypothetical protein
MNGWEGGGGVSRIVASPTVRIMLKELPFNNARSTLLTRYAAELTRRTEYNPGTPFPEKSLQ